MIAEQNTKWLYYLSHQLLIRAQHGAIFGRVE